MVTAANLVNGVCEQAAEYGHAVPYATGRAGQVHDESAGGKPGYAARQGR